MNRFLPLLFLLFSALGTFAQTADTVFSRCPDVPNHPYYYPKLRYEGDFWAIKKHFYEGFPTEEFAVLSNNTGIATVHFWVNCRGMSGDFRTECYGHDYKPIVLHERIVRYLVERTARLRGWIPARFENGQVANSHKFFTFRIDHGKLVDILPQ